MLSANCSKLFWLECRFGEYDLHDLVELDQTTAGVMIAADAETCQILTNRNAVSPLHHFCYACMFIRRTDTKQDLMSFGLLCTAQLEVNHEKQSGSAAYASVKQFTICTWSHRPQDVCCQEVFEMQESAVHALGV